MFLKQFDEIYRIIVVISTSDFLTCGLDAADKNLHELICAIRYYLLTFYLKTVLKRGKLKSIFEEEESFMSLA